MQKPRRIQSVQASLRSSNIEFRFWYGQGRSHQSYFSRSAHGNLDVSESIAPRVLGLPVAPDLGMETIGRVVAKTEAGISFVKSIPLSRIG
jgi:dTDP-4-amino-4,6-dideoxygalactose transaminase